MSPVVKCLVDMVPSSCTLTTDVHLSDTALWLHLSPPGGYPGRSLQQPVEQFLWWRPTRQLPRVIWGHGRHRWGCGRVRWV